MLPACGWIWRWDRFYPDARTGELLPKYLLVLAHSRGGDIVVRLLTSRAALRGDQQCSHDDTRPGYYLGVIDPTVGLGKETWLDLREFDDVEPANWDKNVAAGALAQVAQLPNEVMCSLLLCAIGAQDTQRQQQEAMYATRAMLGCR